MQRLHNLGIMINGSFVFGLDDDDKDVFKRTVDWGITNGITTSTYHILTPYPGTNLYNTMIQKDRITTKDWSQYDTRHVVFKSNLLSKQELENGYAWAYKEFYKWSNIANATLKHDNLTHMIKHFAYTGGWKKFEKMWNFIIQTGGLKYMLPLLELLLSEVNKPTDTPIAHRYLQKSLS